MSNQHGKAMVYGSFIGDALALGAHWIYDVDRIDRELGIIDAYQPPAEDSYHATKKKGELTHYGDQTLLLLRYLAEHEHFSIEIFGEYWREFASTYDGYHDQATKKTLEAMREGLSMTQCGSGSSDLGGPARMAPLVYRYWQEPERLRSSVHEMTSLTHTGSGIETGTDLLLDVTLAVLAGATPAAAVDQALARGIDDLDLELRLRQAVDSTAEDSRKVIAGFGQMCSISAALPGAIHLILAYPDNLREALIQNVMAGGDSAARGLVVGMILGAHQGMAALDEQWLTELAARDAIGLCLEKIG